MAGLFFFDAGFFSCGVFSMRRITSSGSLDNFSSTGGFFVADDNLIPPITNQQAALVGYLCAKWAELEWIAELIFLGLIGANQRYGGATVRYLPPAQRFALMEDIIKDKYGDTSLPFKCMKPILIQAGELAGERNTIIHSIWRIDAAGAGNYAALLKRGKFEPTNETKFSTPYLLEVVGKVSDCTQDLLSSAHDLNFSFPEP